MGVLADSSFRLRHEIFVCDAYLEQPLEKAHREPYAKQFIQEVLHVLRMEPLGPFNFHDAVDDRAPGWSFIQAITTSHISCHYFEKPGRRPHIRIDFYSCQSVDWRQVIAVSHRFLGLEKWQGTFIERYLDDEGERKILSIRGRGDAVLEEDFVLDGTLNRSSVQLGEPVAVVA